MKIMQNAKYVHHTIIPKQFKCRDCDCMLYSCTAFLGTGPCRQVWSACSCFSPSLHRVKFSKYFRGQLLQSCLQLQFARASTPCESTREQKFNNLGGSHAAACRANRIKNMHCCKRREAYSVHGRGSGAALTSAYAQTQCALRMYCPKFKVICLCLCRFVSRSAC